MEAIKLEKEQECEESSQKLSDAIERNLRERDELVKMYEEKLIKVCRARENERTNERKKKDREKKRKTEKERRGKRKKERERERERKRERKKERLLL